jgi:CRISPR type III-A-associated RAMP protein Csm4
LIKIYAIRFRTPYHVGWREPSEIVESVTIHRALISLAYEIYGVYGDNIVKNIIETKLSSLLPSIKAYDKCYKPLIPYPPIPSKPKHEKAGIKWATINAILEILSRIGECITGNRGIPYMLFETERAKILCNGSSQEIGVKILRDRGILASINEDLEQVLKGSFEPFEEVNIWRNRIDRITGSADLYRVSAFRARTDLILIAHQDPNTVYPLKEMIQILGKIGLGGLRGYGFGKFDVWEANICEEGLKESFEAYVGYKTSGAYLSLGSYLGENIEWERDRSFIKPKEIQGYSGPSNEGYILPVVRYASTGSIVYLKQLPRPRLIEIEASIFKPLLIFNPLLITGDIHAG